MMAMSIKRESCMQSILPSCPHASLPSSMFFDNRGKKRAETDLFLLSRFIREQLPSPSRSCSTTRLPQLPAVFCAETVEGKQSGSQDFGTASYSNACLSSQLPSSCSGALAVHTATKIWSRICQLKFAWSRPHSHRQLQEHVKMLENWRKCWAVCQNRARTDRKTAGMCLEPNSEDE